MAEEAVCTGRVKFFVPEKGWGRLEVTGNLPEGLPAEEFSSGVFVHYKDIVVADEKTLASLDEGQEVSFVLAKGEKGWQANDVKALDGNPVKARLHRTMLAGIFRGVVTHWNSAKAFGWIATDLSYQSLGMQRVPKSVLSLNEGRVYFRWRDCGASREGQEAFVQKGKAVVFQLYWDEKGLGALHVCDAITLQPLASGTLGGAVDGYKQLLAVQELPANEQLAELGKEMPKCLACLVVPRAQAGSIIGQKGETVRGLKERSGVDYIYVDSGSLDHRLVELKGTPAAVAGGALLIAEHLAVEPGGQAAPAPPEVRWAVPDEGFGRVVGKGKTQLTSIENRCAGATLQILPKVQVASGVVQSISVSGEPEAMAEAAKMLLARIVTCSSVMPLPRNKPPEMMPPMPMKQSMGYSQNMGSASAMLMLQQMATMQQGMHQAGGKGCFGGGPKGGKGGGGVGAGGGAYGGMGSAGAGAKGGGFQPGMQQQQPQQQKGGGGGGFRGGFKGAPGQAAAAPQMQNLNL
mmetsp:Transcript_90190/g.250597  ORF Transcript_90190/g.250597 Transcript_90190/m.250597 type:complete len:519 (+) Transcript_90190:68-1624(+)|eukprot:CAMPEP_0179043578 /NCGR_PEP_ID=MMETSP0796-20121207/17236_1 /TAXON_ID=73915 /ORGANISM="Pyrodinium bahamense, Strain pbaha01" /LENGTH=518 /DNA_ID=CAMNT_0020739961 /DNA_START=66 /DNA_END=1622 /DNA_ORIENTATION=-